LTSTASPPPGQVTNRDCRGGRRPADHDRESAELLRPVDHLRAFASAEPISMCAAERGGRPDVVLDDNRQHSVPAAHVEPVLTRSEELTATEAQIRTALSEGRTLAECLQMFGHV
jgi:hypothetical protein